MTIRPPFAYYGGKIRLAEQIAALLPPHKHYVEPFAGSLAVFLAKTPAAQSTLNDLDRDLVTFWRVLRNRPDELVAAAALTPHSRHEHAESSRRDDHPDELEIARRVWAQLTQGRTGTLRDTGWRFRIASDPWPMVRYLAAYTDRMPACAARLADASLECRDALEVVADYGVDPGVCIYADPPYVLSSRSSEGYKHELGAEDDHVKLAEALHACAGAVVLSGYHSQLYDELYAGWHVHEFTAWTTQGSDTKQTRTEVLWSNRPLGHGGLW